MNTQQVIDRIWSEIEPTVFVSRREFVEGLAGWVIATREVDGEIAGATLVRGPEFHFISFGPRKGFTAALITECLQPIIDDYGFVQTKTPKEDKRQQHFNLLIGFEVQGEDEFFTYFRMTQLNLHRGRACLS